ncbi:hypothetical protein [Arthrobacter sp. Z4-13]
MPLLQDSDLHMPEHRPWAFSAVCVMVVALTLLVFGLTQVPVIELLPWYATAYLLIGACIFGPVGKLPSLSQAAAFLLPGVLLVVLALLNLGFWCGGWLLALPAWGLLLTRWTPENHLRACRSCRFWGFWCWAWRSLRSTSSGWSSASLSSCCR